MCCALAVLFWIAGAAPAHAGKVALDRQRTIHGETMPPDNAPRPRATTYQAQVLLGTTLGVFWHEFGHALIGETGLPATGPEEDVADAFSAFVLSASVEQMAVTGREQAFMAGVVKYSALLWYYVAAERQRVGHVPAWQDEHAPDMKRFRNAFCIVYGSNPARYADLARKVGLSERTRTRCRAEHDKRYRAWEVILRTVTRNLGPMDSGAYPANAPGGRILVEFGETGSPAGRTAATLLQQTGIMSRVMRRMERLVVWPRDLKIVFRDCPRPNAWYDRRAGSITLCYGLIEDLSDLIYRAEGRHKDG